MRYATCGFGDCPGPAEDDGFGRPWRAVPMQAPIPAWALHKPTDDAMLTAREVSRAAVIEAAERLGIPTADAVDWYINFGREKRLYWRR